MERGLVCHNGYQSQACSDSMKVVGLEGFGFEVDAHYMVCEYSTLPICFECAHVHFSGDGRPC